MYFNCVEKHEIYVAAFWGHLFYNLFSQCMDGSLRPPSPGSATDCVPNLRHEK